MRRCVMCKKYGELYVEVDWCADGLPAMLPGFYCADCQPERARLVALEAEHRCRCECGLYFYGEPGEIAGGAHRRDLVP